MALGFVSLAAAGCATAQAAGPSAAEFAALHAAQCEDHAARTRNVRCSSIEEEPTEFACRYELPETDGGWKMYEGFVALDGGKWVWLDGETRCYTSAISNLN